MSACMEMPGMLAAVYLVLQVTTGSPVERMVCGCVCVCVCGVMSVRVQQEYGYMYTVRMKRPLLYLVSGYCSSPYPLQS